VHFLKIFKAKLSGCIGENNWRGFCESY